MDISKIDLNKPAFGPGSEPSPTETPAEVSQPKEEVEVKEEPKEEKAEPEVEPTEPEEQRVPYSRFKKFHDEAQKFREEAEHWKTIAEQKVDKEEEKPELPDWWKELYGDSELSQKGWQLQREEFDRLKGEIKEEAVKAYQEQVEAKKQEQEENLKELDSRLNSLSEFVGRELTEQEQSAILDIIDEFTEQDENGKYVGPLLSEEKAWQIYNLKKAATEAPKKKARDEVAALAGESHSGDSVENKDKDFNPLNWDAWKKRI